MKTIKLCLLLFCLSCLFGCGQVDIVNSFGSDRLSLKTSDSNLAETPTPKIITELNRQLEQYNPQVKIIAPRQERVFPSTDISVELEVAKLPVFQDAKLKLGNHLDLILDNEPAKSIYDVTKPIVLKNLTPGTHTIRVFASRPWGESYKNEGAYAQTTFSVLTETNDNRPDRNLPLLTYNNPTGTYGAEPVLLDFYLTNAPLHSVAKSEPNLLDWKIKTTVNGDSFFLENWQPVYLTGLNPGENWIQLELIDEAGNNIENTYNNTVRVINYDSQQSDTLSQLMSDTIALAEAQPLIEQNYYIQPVDEPEILEPTIKLEEPEDEKIEDEELKIDKPNLETVEEPTIEDNASAETSQKEDLNQIGDREISTTESTPVVVPTPSTKNIDDLSSNNIKIAEKNSLEKAEAADFTESQPNITIIEENSDTSEPIAEIPIPEPEAVEITEDEIAITIPPLDSNAESDEEIQSPVWWKKILVRLRQKLEGLVRLLPNEA